MYSTPTYNAIHFFLLHVVCLNQPGHKTMAWITISVWTEDFFPPNTAVVKLRHPDLEHSAGLLVK